MSKTLNSNFNQDQFFKDAQDLNIDKNDSYLFAYPHFLHFFEDKPTLKEQDLVIGIHFTYGWMPTIFKFGDTKAIPSVLAILNRAKANETLTVDDLQTLKTLFKNSLKQVGYPLSAMRVVELVMFIKGAKEKAEKLEFSIDVGAGEKM